MPSLHLIRTEIGRLAGTGKQTTYQDTKLPGFILMVSAKGKKTFAVRRRIDGPDERFMIGREMRWADIDQAGQRWRIPITKNGKPQTVPLVSAALAIIERRRRSVGYSPATAAHQATLNTSTRHGSESANGQASAICTYTTCGTPSHPC